jgi:hypothetical protein
MWTEGGKNSLLAAAAESADSSAAVAAERLAGP